MKNFFKRLLSGNRKTTNQPIVYNRKIKRQYTINGITVNEYEIVGAA